VRTAAATFFSSVGRNKHDLILNCYRLADRYKRNPDEFIDMPISRLLMHVRYTIELIDVQERARHPRDEDE
jgi:hypothetical protein